MQTDKKSLSAISVSALKVCSREELAQMSKPALRRFLHLIAERLDRQPPPSVDELPGIKERVLEHLWHPETGRQS